jgi:drug/metabolite transporter (DMT)-like permease
MAVVPPIAASGVILPVLVGLATGAAPNAITRAGLAVAIVGVVLSSVGRSAATVDGTPGQRIAPATLGLCLIAACGFALIFVALDAAARDGAGQALVATAGVRLGSFTTVLLGLCITRTDPRVGVTPRAALGFGGIGVLDTSANLVFALATTTGQLAVVAVLGSLYPAVTSGLAHAVLGERLGRVQVVGVLCALVGFALLAGA